MIGCFSKEKPNHQEFLTYVSTLLGAVHEISHDKS